MDFLGDAGALSVVEPAHDCEGEKDGARVIGEAGVAASRRSVASCQGHHDATTRLSQDVVGAMIGMRTIEAITGRTGKN